MSVQTRLKILQPILLVMLLVVFLRAWAVSLLPQDFDEPIYVQNGFDYAAAFRSSGLDGLIDYPGNPEHPALVKLLYGGLILALGEGVTWTSAFFAARIFSALFGVLAVLIVALAVDPLAAGMLAVHTLAGKYTSQAYLEAVPHAMTIASVLMLQKAVKGHPDKWFWLSAIALGVAAASKYSYIPVIVLVLGYLAIFEKKIKFQWLILFSLVSLAVFFALNIRLWHDPIQRLVDSLGFHLQYSQGQHVEEVGYPWFQPLIWIFSSSPASWHPNVFFYFGFDGIIAILAFGRLRKEWKERRWLVIWLLSGILFLLIWPTKWPQYALTVTPALCILAAESLRRLFQWIKVQESYWEYLKEMLPKPSRWLWISIIAFLLFIAAIYLSAAIKLAVGRVGWSNISRENSFLPSNTVYALQPLDDGRMLLGTEKGAAIWMPAQNTDESPAWEIYNTANSGLPGNRILSLALDQNGGYWFGTENGVALLNGDRWTSYHSTELGLEDEYILSLAASPDGRMYAGTLSGAAAWNGIQWSPIEEVEGQAVFAITVAYDGEVVWFGLEEGAGKLHIRDHMFHTYPSDAAVKKLLIDSHGVLWAATSGAGIARLDGSSWTYFRNNNSDISFNITTCISEVQPGEFWIGTALPTTSGGAAVRWDGLKWHSFLKNNSGASGAEVTAIAVQSDQVWLATRTSGIDLFNLGRNK